MRDRLYLSLNAFLSVITFDLNSHHRREITIAAIFQMKISRELSKLSFVLQGVLCLPEAC